MNYSTTWAPRLVLLCFLIFICGGPGPFARAQSSAKVQGFVVNADSMFRDSENETMELEGHVQVIYQTQHLKADKAKINLRTRQA
jgi:LPS-assembly protein